jgi:N-acylneuraminate cytidylyltransferase
VRGVTRPDAAPAADGLRVCILPARGGSKRIPRKNVRPFAGRPIIAWPIATARASACFDRVIVSTDDPEIAETAERAGAEVPFRRPAELADDHTGTLDVIAHALNWLAAEGCVLAAAACIYPTAVLLSEADIRAGAALLAGAEVDYAVAVTEYPFPVQRAVQLDRRGALAMLQPEHAATRSQDLPAVYHDAGALYWGRPAAFLQRAPLFSPRARAIVLPRSRVVDIDTPEDWEIAEALFERRHARARVHD